MKTKEELEQSVVMLEERVEANNTMNKGYADDLVKAKRDLADFNKPELTTLQLQQVEDAIHNGVSNFDFSDEDNFDKEFSLDYDGKVQLDNLDLTNGQELVEEIMAQVVKLFSELEDEDND